MAENWIIGTIDDVKNKVAEKMALWDSDGWKEGMNKDIKGRIAEAIIEQMFRRSGVELYFFGVEWRQSKHANESEIFLRTKQGYLEVPMVGFRKSPDFLIITHQGYRYELVEVKFRNSGLLYSRNDLNLFRELQSTKDCDTKVVWVSRSMIEVIVPPYLDSCGELIKESVLSQKTWGIKEEVFMECLNYLEVYGLLFPKA